MRALHASSQATARKADEAETSLADQLVEIDQPFHVREAEIAADMMHLEIVAPRPARAYGFDAEHADLLLAAEPGRGFLGDAGKVGDESRRAMRAPVEVHVQQHGVLRLDGDAGGLLSGLQVLDRDVGLQGLVREVEAHRLREEVLQRHLIDRRGARLGVKMLGRVDVGTGMIAHHQRHRRGREFVPLGVPDLVVGGEGRDDDLRMVRQHLHLMFDVAAEIDQDHGSFPVVRLPSRTAR